MVRVLTVFFALFSLPALAIVPSGPNYFNACGAQVPIPPGITLPGPGITSNSVVSLACRATGANTYCSMRRANDTQRYVVPAGKTLRVFHACANPGSASATTGFTIGYGTSDVGMAGASAPTAASWSYNDQNQLYGQALTFSSPNQGTFMDYDIPTGKIPAAQVDAAVVVRIFGYEY